MEVNKPNIYFKGDVIMMKKMKGVALIIFVLVIMIFGAYSKEKEMRESMETTTVTLMTDGAK